MRRRRYSGRSSSRRRGRRSFTRRRGRAGRPVRIGYRM